MNGRAVRRGGTYFCCFFLFFFALPHILREGDGGMAFVVAFVFCRLGERKKAGWIAARGGNERGEPAWAADGGQPKAGKGMVEVGNKKWAREGGVGVSDMKNAQKIRGVGPGKINEKNI